jgi:hypothetical protein
MAFLKGAIDKKNLANFKTLIRKSRIAEFHQDPHQEDDYYVVELNVSMDPEIIVRVLEQYDRKNFCRPKQDE